MKPFVATALLLLLCHSTIAAPAGQNSDPNPKESSNVQKPSQELEVPFDRDTLPGYDFSYTYYGVGPKVQSGGEQSVRQGKGLEKIFKSSETPGVEVEVGPEHTTDSQDVDRDIVKTQGKEHAKEAQVLIPAAPAPDDSGSEEMINDFDDDGTYDARDETGQKQPGESSQDSAVQNNPRAKRQLIVGLGVPFGYGYGGYGYGYGYGRPWGYGGYYRRPWGYGGYGYGRPWGGRWRG